MRSAGRTAAAVVLADELAARQSGDVSGWASSSASRAVMAANRRRDTRPELRLRSLLHGRGLRYRVDYRLPFDRRRRADVVFTKLRLAVFVDGCFWHGCPDHYVAPSANDSYWLAKVTRNRERDLETTRVLEADGWTVVRVWEHESPADAADRVVATVQGLRAASGGMAALAPVTGDALDSVEEETDCVADREEAGEGDGRSA